MMGRQTGFSGRYYRPSLTNRRARLAYQRKIKATFQIGSLVRKKSRKGLVIGYVERKALIPYLVIAVQFKSGTENVCPRLLYPAKP